MCAVCTSRAVLKIYLHKIKLIKNKQYGMYDASRKRLNCAKGTMKRNKINEQINVSVIKYINFLIAIDNIISGSAKRARCLITSFHFDTA